MKWFKLRPAKYTKQEWEVHWCLWKHFKAFYEQCRDKRKADFGEPCSDCKFWDSCKGDWISKIGKSRPADIGINVGQAPD